MKNNKYVSILLGLVALTTMVAGVPALASTTPPNGHANGIWVHLGKGMLNRKMKPAVFGTVTAVSGNIITITGKQSNPLARLTNTTANTTVITYTVDATNAKIVKNNIAGNISSILVGDTIMAQGTLTGTNLVATNIRDGVAKNGLKTITGNGEPVVAGTITNVTGTTFTMTNQSNVSYTVDATNAKIIQNGNTITTANLAVGDAVVVQGTVTGNSVLAVNVIDHVKNSTISTGTTTVPAHKGFFGRVGSFFGRIFGF